MNQLFFLIFILSFFNVPLMALDNKETISAILQNISKNRSRPIFNRGSEDGIQIGDVVSIYRELEEGAEKKKIGVAAAIITEGNLSEWVLLEKYHDEYFQENSELILVSLYGDNKPNLINLREFQKSSFLAELNNEKERLKNERIKEKLHISGLYEKYDLSPNDSHKIPKFNFEFKAAPLAVKQPIRHKKFQYGLSFSNVQQEEYLLQGHYEYAHFAFRTVDQKTEFKLSEYRGSLRYDRFQYIGNFFNRVSIAEFRREKSGTVAPINYQMTIGPYGLGKKWKFKSRFKEISSSYVPVLEYSLYDQIKTQQNPVAGENLYVSQVGTYLRHRFDLGILLELSTDFTLQNQMVWRPKQNIDDLSFDWEDANWENLLIGKYQIGKEFSLSYQNRLTRDSRRRTYLNYPQTIWEHIFFISYTLSP